MSTLHHGPLLHSPNHLWLVVAVCVFGALVLVLAPRDVWRTSDTVTDATTGEGAEVQAILAQLPLTFISNAGQSDPQVRFQVRGAGHTIFFTPDAVVFSASQMSEDETASVSSVVRLRFEGANPSPLVEGIEPLAGVANFFIGNDPSRWHSGVNTYGGVAYRALYPGVDLIYRGSEGQLKSEFVVSPGVDPGVIALDYSGMESIRIGDGGALVLETEFGQLVEESPVVYQKIGGARVSVDGRYDLLGNDRVGFELGGFDGSYPLVIDPTLVYSTYLGGSGQENYHAGEIAVDGNGNAYVTGNTFSRDFPMVNPLQGEHAGDYTDAFVTKLNAAGTALMYSTYLGGSGGESGLGIAVDSSGNAYVVGVVTNSTDFPTQNPIQSAPAGDDDAFVTKLNPSGTSLVYSTYLGGSGEDRGLGIAVDGGGHAYVTGYTGSTDFPTQNPIQSALAGYPYDDAFVAKFSASGTSLVFSTYLGGRGSDAARDIAVDSSGHAYVTGQSGSADFPTTNTIQGAPNDGAFVTKFSASGTSLLYSTCLSGSDGNSSDGYGIAVDRSGNAYVTGNTLSADFPRLNPLQGTKAGGHDAFVSKLNASGTALVYSTYLGGSGYEGPGDIAVDGHGNAYLTGPTTSTDFPTQNAIQSVYGGGDFDAFVSKLNAAGSALVYSTYLGGSEGELSTGVPVRGGIAVDARGNAYVTGNTASEDFPTQNPIQSAPAGDRDAFVTKISGDEDDGSAFLQSLGDINAAGGQDSGVVAYDSGAEQAQATVKALNGSVVNQFNFGAGLKPIDIEVIEDINNNGAPEFAFLGKGSTKAEVRDSLTGQLLGSATFSSSFEPIDLEILPDQNGNGVPELAVLQKGSARVEIRDGMSGAWIKAISFNGNYIPKDLALLPNVGGTSAFDLAVLHEQTDPNQHDRVEIRDYASKQLVRNVYAGKGFTVKQLEVLEDVNGNNKPELAVLREGSVNVLVKDAGTGGHIRNVGFNASYTPLKLLVVRDTDNDGEQELGLYAVHPDQGYVKIELRDVNGGQLTKNVWFGKQEQPQDATVYPDINGNGSPEVGALGRVKSNPDQLKLRIKDAKTGKHIKAMVF